MSYSLMYLQYGYIYYILYHHKLLRESTCCSRTSCSRPRPSIWCPCAGLAVEPAWCWIHHLRWSILVLLSLATWATTASILSLENSGLRVTVVGPPAVGDFVQYLMYLSACRPRPSSPGTSVGSFEVVCSDSPALYTHIHMCICRNHRTCLVASHLQALVSRWQTEIETVQKLGFQSCLVA